MNANTAEVKTEEMFYRQVAGSLSRLSPRTRKEEQLLKESLARLAAIKRSPKPKS